MMMMKKAGLSKLGDGFVSVGIAICGLQLLAVLFVLPVSRAAYRVANMVMMESLWSQLIWLLDWWAAVQVGEACISGDTNQACSNVYPPELGLHHQLTAEVFSAEFISNVTGN